MVHSPEGGAVVSDVAHIFVLFLVLTQRKKWCTLRETFHRRRTVCYTNFCCFSSLLSYPCCTIMHMYCLRCASGPCIIPSAVTWRWLFGYKHLCLYITLQPLLCFLYKWNLVTASLLWSDLLGGVFTGQRSWWEMCTLMFVSAASFTLCRMCFLLLCFVFVKKSEVNLLMWKYGLLSKISIRIKHKTL